MSKPTAEQVQADTLRRLNAEVARLQAQLADAQVIRQALEGAGVTDTNGTLHWVFAPHEREASSFGGTERQRWGGLFQQVRYIIDGLARRAEQAEADRDAARAERDELVSRIPTDAPDRGGRLVLNAYGRRCYDEGRKSAEAELDRARQQAEPKHVFVLSERFGLHGTEKVVGVALTDEDERAWVGAVARDDARSAIRHPVIRAAARLRSQE